MSAPEPTAADVLAELQAMTAEVRATHAEIRAQLAEMRADWAERALRTSDRLDDISRHLSVLTNMVAAFRAEYNIHHHPHRHGEDGRDEAA